MKYLIWILCVLLVVPFCFRQKTGELLRRDEARMVRGGQVSGCNYLVNYTCTAPSTKTCSEIPCTGYSTGPNNPVYYNCDKGNGSGTGFNGTPPDANSEYQSNNQTYRRCLDSSQVNLSPGTYEGNNTCTNKPIVCYQQRQCPTGATCISPARGKPWMCSQSQQAWQNGPLFSDQSYGNSSCYFDVGLGGGGGG